MGEAPVNAESPQRKQGGVACAAGSILLALTFVQSQSNSGSGNMTGGCGGWRRTATSKVRRKST
jgi:hypothetical protein